LQMLKRCALATVPIAVMLACSDGMGPSRPASVGAVGTQTGYIITPVGRMALACVREIEAGERLEKNGVVRHVDGSTSVIPSCASSAPARGRGVVRDPLDSGWAEADTAHATSGGWFSELTAAWKVPAQPVEGGALFFTFPGLQSDSFIIQTVAQFGNNGHFGGNYWTIASWHCHSLTNCGFSQPVTVNAGDQLQGSITATNCANGNCLWTITTTDLTTGAKSTLPVTDTLGYTFAAGGATEVYGITSCNQFPVNGVFFTSELTDQTGTSVSPAWSPYYSTGSISPVCGFNATASVAFHAGLLGLPGFYASTIDLFENPVSVTALGGYTASCPSLPASCTPAITSLGASGATITVNGTSSGISGSGSGTMALTGATASGSFAATCSGTGSCVAGIASVTASGSTIKMVDTQGHTGTITLTGATATGGFSASCSSPTTQCTPTITVVQGTGSNVLSLYDGAGHTGTITLQ
jgi:hypothetical protein